MFATKIEFFAFRVHFDPLKLRYSQLLFYHFFRKILILIFYFICIGQNIDINPSKRP